VNKVATAVQLRFRCAQVRPCRGAVRRRLIRIAGKRVSKERRSAARCKAFQEPQERNRQDAAERLRSVDPQGCGKTQKANQNPAEPWLKTSGDWKANASSETEAPSQARDLVQLARTSLTVVLFFAAFVKVPSRTLAARVFLRSSWDRGLGSKHLHTPWHWRIPEVPERLKILFVAPRIRGDDGRGHGGEGTPTGFQCATHRADRAWYVEFSEIVEPDAKGCVGSRSSPAASCTGQTGVEMEALCAANVGAANHI